MKGKDNMEGKFMIIQAPKIKVSIAEGHVMMYQSRLAMIFSWFPRIVRSGSAFSEASTW